LGENVRTVRATAREECRFIDGARDGDFLYARFHLPRKESSGTGVVIAPPVGHERLRCYRELVSLARSLASAGHPAIFADYRGEGESSGCYAETDLASRVEDVETMARELESVASCEKLAIVGVRLGAVLALLAAKRVEVSALALVEPVTSPSVYARDLLRANMILQRQYQGGIRRNAAALKAALQAGETVSVYGFHLGWPLLGALEELDPLPLQKSFAGRALILHFEHRSGRARPDLEGWRQEFGRAAGRPGLAEIVTPFSWAGKNVWIAGIEPLERKIAEWLGEDR
jgi:pimeloyl-ACP methyl ester carboxylesterase